MRGVPMNDVLRIVDVTVRLGTQKVIHEVSLGLAEGESAGLIGSSGSGKTTLALAVLGLLPAGARVTGSISVAGAQVVGASERELRRLRGRHVALVGQDAQASLNPLTRIGSQLSIPLRRHRGMSGRALTAAVVELLEQVELAPRTLGMYPPQLSGGQRQRVAIALALACRPALLVADEPTSALDPTTRAGVLALLRTLPGRGAHPTSLLLISHETAAVRQLCTRVIVLDQGRVVRTGRVDEVFRAPRPRAPDHLVDAPGRRAPGVRPTMPVPSERWRGEP
jgi:peptide/nickel transport system ATP-binding protein